MAEELPPEEPECLPQAPSGLDSSVLDSLAQHSAADFPSVEALNSHRRLGCSLLWRRNSVQRRGAYRPRAHSSCRQARLIPLARRSGPPEQWRRQSAALRLLAARP
jgi:hypothetical protein